MFDSTALGSFFESKRKMDNDTFPSEERRHIDNNSFGEGNEEA